MIKRNNICNIFHIQLKHTTQIFSWSNIEERKQRMLTSGGSRGGAVWGNCPNEFRLRPEQEASLSPPILEPEVFRQQMYCIEECVCDIVGIFWRPRNHSAPLQYLSAPRVIPRPGNCAPLSLRYAPADWTIIQRAKSYRCLR